MKKSTKRAMYLSSLSVLGPAVMLFVFSALMEAWTGHEPVPGKPNSTWTAMMVTCFLVALPVGMCALFTYEQPQHRRNGVDE